MTKTKTWLMTGIVSLLTIVAHGSGAAEPQTHGQQLAESLRKSDGPVMVVAHRGCWKGAPENSLAAIRDCIALGVDAVELDLRFTSDGELVVMHDRTLDRTTNITGKVAATSFADVRKARLRQGKGGGDSALTDERIPTFREVLLAARGKILVYVDDKAMTFKAAAREARKLGMADQVILSRFVTPGDDDISQLARTGIAFNPVIVDTSQNASLSAVVTSYASAPPKIYQPVFSNETWFVEGVRQMKRQKARIMVVTLWEDSFAGGHTDARAIANPDQHWGRLIAIGADMVMTDEPEALIAYLEGIGRGTRATIR